MAFVERAVQGVAERVTKRGVAAFVGAAFLGDVDQPRPRQGESRGAVW